ncbi:MAG: phosphopantetheine-binding protein [Pantoea sp.]|nr:phosphopantetheine-binding protein [Pantoea sp.]
MQVTPTASFTSDLGLDSLDAVEVVMAIEGQSLFFPALSLARRGSCWTPR